MERMGRWQSWEEFNLRGCGRIQFPEGLDMYAKPWTSLNGLQGLPLCERQLDVIDVVCTKARQANPSMEILALEEQLMVDVTVCVGQAVPLFQNMWPTLRPKTMLYMFGSDCLTSGSDHMSIIGFPRSRQVQGFTDNDLRDLAGDATSLPICGLVISACFLNPLSEWWSAPSSRARSSVGLLRKINV